MVHDQHHRGPTPDEERREGGDAALRVDHHVEATASRAAATRPPAGRTSARRHRARIRMPSRTSRAVWPSSRAVRNSTRAPAATRARANSHAYRSDPPASAWSRSRQLTIAARAPASWALRHPGRRSATGGSVARGERGPRPCTCGHRRSSQPIWASSREGRRRRDGPGLKVEPGDVDPGHRELRDRRAVDPGAAEHLDIEGEAVGAGLGEQPRDQTPRNSLKPHWVSRIIRAPGAADQRKAAGTALAQRLWRVMVTEPATARDPIAMSAPSVEQATAASGRRRTSHRPRP